MERTQLVGVRQGKLEVERRLGRVVAQVRLEQVLVVLSQLTDASGDLLKRLLQMLGPDFDTGAFSLRKVARTSESSVRRLYQLTWPFE